MYEGKSWTFCSLRVVAWLKCEVSRDILSDGLALLVVIASPSNCEGEARETATQTECHVIIAVTSA